MCLAVGVCAGGMELLRPRGSSGTSPQPPPPPPTAPLWAQGSTMAALRRGLSPGLGAGSCRGGHKAGVTADAGGLRALGASPRRRTWSRGAAAGRPRAGGRWLSPLGAVMALRSPGKEGPRSAPRSAAGGPGRRFSSALRAAPGCGRSSPRGPHGPRIRAPRDRLSAAGSPRGDAVGGPVPGDQRPRGRGPWALCPLRTRPAGVRGRTAAAPPPAAPPAAAAAAPGTHLPPPVPAQTAGTPTS